MKFLHKKSSGNHSTGMVKISSFLLSAELSIHNNGRANTNESPPRMTCHADWRNMPIRPA